MNRQPFVLWAAALLLLGAGLLVGRYLLPREAGTSPAATAAPEREVLYWYDPMVPEQRFDRPGRSPFMDMDLVPRYADEVQRDSVRIDPAIQQNLGLRTATVERGSLQRTVTVPGTLQWDLRAERRVSARVDGVIDQLLVATPYQRVQAGQPLATLLAPDWSAALAEYRALASGESAASEDLLAAARSRLRMLGINPRDIDAAASAGVPRITLRAPIDGVLGEIAVRGGQRVAAGDALFRVNGTDALWMLAELPQAAVDLALVGREATVTASALPGEAFNGTIEALLPDVDPTTRTQRARIVLVDPDPRLVAGMFAEARLPLSGGDPHPLVPIDAVLVGGDTSRVIVALDAQHFVPVEVELGRRSGEQVEVVRGLRGGERIVVSGQFLVDSEASLRGVLRRLEAGKVDPAGAASAATGHSHAHPNPPVAAEAAPTGNAR